MLKALRKQKNKSKWALEPNNFILNYETGSSEIEQGFKNSELLVITTSYILLLINYLVGTRLMNYFSKIL